MHLRSTTQFDVFAGASGFHLSQEGGPLLLAPFVLLEGVITRLWLLNNLAIGIDDSLPLTIFCHDEVIRETSCDQRKEDRASH
jgi:hypothetical protein